ncbi:G5 domain-containing protein [Hutsoniella sourekii]
MKQQETSRKVMRKVKNIWVAVLLLGTSISVQLAPTTSTALARQMAITENLKEGSLTSFESKEAFKENPLVEKEIQETLDRWTRGEVRTHSIQEEIKRQEEGQLPVYVIQEGDNWQELAEGCQQTAETLARQNGLQVDDDLVVGDLMVGVVDTPASYPKVNRYGSSQSEALSKSYSPNRIVEEPKAQRQIINPAPETNTPAHQAGEPQVLSPRMEQEAPSHHQLVEDKDPTFLSMHPTHSEPQLRPSELELDEMSADHQDEVAELPASEENEMVRLVSEEDLPNEGRTGEEYTPGEDVVDTKIDEQVEEIPGEPKIVKETVTETVMETVTETVIETVTETVMETETRPVIGEDGQPVVGEDGTPLMETVEVPKEITKEVPKEIIKEVPKEVTREVEKEVPGEPKQNNTRTTTTTTTHNPGVKTIYDNTLAEGTEQVEQEGAAGKTVSVTTEVLIDGVVQSSDTKQVESTPAIDKVVRVGTGKPGGKRQVYEHVTILKHGVQYQNNLDAYTGERTEIQAGQDGKKVVTEEVVLDGEGKEVSRKQLSEDIRPAQDQIISVGIKPVYTSETVTEDQEIPYQTETKTVQLAPGQEPYEKVIRNGETGFKRISYSVSYERGKETGRQASGEEVVKKPVNEIKEIGVVAKIQTDVKQEEKIDSYQTKTEKDNTKYTDYRQVKVRGVNGKALITTTTKYYIDGNGNRVELGQESREDVLVNRVDEVVVVGTKEKPAPTLAPEQGKVYGPTFGKKVGTYKDIQGNTITDFRIEVDKPYNEIAAMSDDEVYRLSKQNKKNMQVGYNAENNYNYRTSITPTTEFVKEYNETNNLFNHRVYNNEMLRLVNDLRRGLGLHEYTLDQDLADAAGIRAREQAAYGSLRSNGKPHTRPDGTSYKTVSPKAYGENMAENWFTGNPYEMMSERAVAEKFFDQWKTSPGHYAAMTAKYFTTMGNGMAINEGHGVNKKPEAFTKTIGTMLFGGLNW